LIYGFLNKFHEFFIQSSGYNFGLTFGDELGPDLEEGDENAGYDEDERVYQLHIKHI